MRFLSTLAASVLGTIVAIIALFIFLFLFLFAVSLSGDTTPQVRSGSVLTMEVSGPIPERVPDDPLTRQLSGQSGYDLGDVLGSLSKAKNDDRISAVWLQLKGSSASWATLEEVRAAIQELRESGKPVIASSGDFGMLEKDYFLATAADSIFAGPVTSFEFNGLYLPQTFFRGTLEKLDIEPKVVRAGQFKSAVETFTREDLSEENELQLQALVDTQYDTFLTAISEARGISVEQLREIASSDAPMDVEPAKELGMIDDIRYTDEVIDVLRGILDLDGDANVPTIDISDYSRVPGSEVGLEPSGEGSIAVVYGTGQIVPGDPGEGAFGNVTSMGSDPVVDALDDAREDDNVKAVVFRVDSPGGSAAASEAIWRAVTRTRDAKPVIVSMGTLAASGGYYVAAPADTIVANPNTITGSIGVFGLLFNVEGFFSDKLGISIDDVNTSDLADIYSPYSDFSERERDLLGESIDRTYQTFLQRVADGRGMTVEQVDAIAQGRVWSGKDAKEQGLVDVLGSMDDAIKIAGEKAGLGEGPFRVRFLPREKTFFERLNEDLSGQAAQIYWNRTATDLEKELRSQKEMIRYYLGQSGKVQARLPQPINIQ